MNKDQEHLAKKYKKHGVNTRFIVLSGVWFDPTLNRYVKSWRGKRSKQLKRLCNKRLRKMNIDIGRKKSQYKRHTMYWNELY
jgi:hypothetical protein